jgi:hypothetical protein
MAANENQQLNKTIPYGYASLVWNPRTANLVVTLSLTGLAPDSALAASICRGNCIEAGPVVYPLRDMLADKHGNAFTTTTISNLATGIPASGWYIAVHDDLSQMTPVYCGNIINISPNTSHVQIIRVGLA